MATLWDQLHLRALHHRGGDDTDFLRGFARKIPNYGGGCFCREHWKIFVLANPPPFDPPLYFEWTVKAHNYINEKLGKPIVSVEDARKRLLGEQ